MKFENVVLDIADSVAIISINKPPVNALDSGTYGELYEMFYYISKDKNLKVVLLTSSIQNYFVAGADVKEFANLDSETGLMYTRRNQGVREYIRTFPKPIICAINGLAYGGGLALALMCDIRIASEEAKFNLGEINMGILGATQYIAHLSHFGTARKLVYSGEPISAEEALMAGFVDEIVSKEKLIERSLSLAGIIASKSPIALKLAKQCMIQSQRTMLEDGLKYEEDVLRILWGTEDKNEAVRAFLEKREPKFEGK